MEARRRDTVSSMCDLLASRGLRPLAVAVRAIDPATAPMNHDAGGDSGARAWSQAIASGTIESGLTLVALLGLRDPLRAGAAESVSLCRSGGIKVRLATGEHLHCAKFLAEQTGILSGDGVVLDGASWREMSPDDRSAVIPRLEVLARATPADKLLLVEGLKELGEVVLATGDGTQDAGALASASIGCAMGSSCTEVAKEAAKILVVDGAFSSVVGAVLWGRAILENIRKFLTFQLTINAVAVTLTLISAILHMGSDTPFPLEAIQLLWINLIMDSFGALMLATEEPDLELMGMRPQDRALPLLSPGMYKQVGVHSLVQLGLLLFLSLSSAGAAVFGLLPAAVGSRLHYTCIFNTFVWLNLFNFFNARRIHDQRNLFKGLGKARFGLGLLLVLALLQVFWVQVGADALKTAALSAPQFLIGVGLGAFTLLLGAVARMVPMDSISVFLQAAGVKGGSSSIRVAPLGGGPSPYKPFTRSGAGSTAGSSSFYGGADEGERSRLTGGGGGDSPNSSRVSRADMSARSENPYSGRGSSVLASGRSAANRSSARVAPNPYSEVDHVALGVSSSASSVDNTQQSMRMSP
jgi:Ca2+-transporting ATPase